MLDRVPGRLALPMTAFVEPIVKTGYQQEDGYASDQKRSTVRWPRTLGRTVAAHVTVPKPKRFESPSPQSEELESGGADGN